MARGGGRKPGSQRGACLRCRPRCAAVSQHPNASKCCAFLIKWCNQSMFGSKYSRLSALASLFLFHVSTGFVRFCCPRVAFHPGRGLPCSRHLTLRYRHTYSQPIKALESDRSLIQRSNISPRLPSHSSEQLRSAAAAAITHQQIISAADSVIAASLPASTSWQAYVPSIGFFANL